MDYGTYPLVNYDPSTNQMPGGAILNGDWDNILPVDARDPEQVQEFVTHSWYQYPDNDRGLHPWDGMTEPHYELGRTRRARARRSNRSTKAPSIRGSRRRAGAATRWRSGRSRATSSAMRMRSRATRTARGSRSRSTRRCSRSTRTCRSPGLPETTLGAKQLLPTTIGRTLARALEAQYCAEMMSDDWQRLVDNIRNGDTSTANVEKWDPSTWPAEAKGVGTVAAPRGALGHWIKIKDGRIENYQCVVPSTWNGGPRDAKARSARSRRA
jgi:hydrogenase large subunit